MYDTHMKEISGRSRVLGNWQPSKLDPFTIETELKSYLEKIFKAYLCAPVISCRRPESNRNQDSSVNRFHSDGDVDYFIVWSNKHSTIVKFRNNKLLKAQDGDVILVNNRKSEHMRPNIQDSGGGCTRWFIRISALKLAEIPQSWVRSHRETDI